MRYLNQLEEEEEGMFVDILALTGIAIVGLLIVPTIVIGGIILLVFPKTWRQKVVDGFNETFTQEND